MLNRFAKLLLTATAIAPVLITYAWIAFRSGNNTAGVALLLTCAVLIAICWGLLAFCKKHLERIAFSVTSVEAADRENMGFLLLYLLPLFTSSFGDLNWELWVPAILIFAVVVATGYNYHFNPLLGLLGWHFYKVGTKEGVTYVLITKRQIRSATETALVGQLTEYIVMDMGDAR